MDVYLVEEHSRIERVSMEREILTRVASNLFRGGRPGFTEIFIIIFFTSLKAKCGCNSPLTPRERRRSATFDSR